MSNSPKVERKTKAIMFTDIAGYTKAMSESEQKALEMLRKKRSIIKTLIDNYDGKYVKEIGDGTLSYFESGYNASSCAKELQKKVKAENLDIRVGIHIGDIVFDNNDVYGDGVNVASRLESIAPAGGVLISKNVYDELINKDDFDGIPLGLQSLKGVGRLVEVYAIKDEYLVIPKTDDYKKTEVEVHKDDEVPSIAIIPFENKGAEEDIFYAYGISADLISDCSGAGLIRVASLKNIEKINDYDKMQAEELASKLDVRYTAEGTLWKMGDMFQLSIELYDTKEKKVVWSDRWQENWDNLSTIKGNLSDGLLKALDTTPKKEMEIKTANPEAYEFYLKAIHKYRKRKNEDDIEVVKGLLNKAFEIDENLFLSKIKLGNVHINSGQYDKALDTFNFILPKVKKLNDNENIGRCYAAKSTALWHQSELDESIKYSTLAIEKLEKLENKEIILESYEILGVAYADKFEYKKAIKYLKKVLHIAEELEDKHWISRTYNNIGYTLIYTGDYENAIKYFKQSLNLEKSIGNLRPIYLLHSLGEIYRRRGEYKKALKYLDKTLKFSLELGDKRIQWAARYDLGLCFFELNMLEKAKIELKFVREIQNETKTNENVIETNIFLFNVYKKLKIDFDVNYIKENIKDVGNLDFEVIFGLYKLLENKLHLETAYNQIKEKADAMEDELKEKFQGYPIPKQIIEEYNKVFS